ncbi:MAG: ATP-dependent helicase HrpB, partial [Desulfuromonadales bacterium]|nr:ATP-dependent helicase HrpB [Desulfuromonadales bacterium]NIR32959.1 ATP-dependent helicase HrpB [Desulfuromonadales bacterium]NIS40517.1 ATP-dependent helicase HrpB [Desulfuromonadales bacterium]
MADRLPIDSILPSLRQALEAQPAAVVQAPPGAGKTTRVPLALLDEPWLAGQSILMLEPRRLAATNAARFMASQLHETVGETVGYAIRYDRRVSKRTRVEVVTEGILTRRLQADPELSGIGLVIFDEFHERSLNSDLALALCHDARHGLREDLRLLVMSATLDAEPVARLLGNAPLVTSAGRSYPIDIRYLSRDPEGRPDETATAAVRRALAETDGDVLVFLPGVAEIRRCAQQLAGLGDVDVHPLYGTLPFAEQERAILPGPRRRVVLATNIAETSLTIEGIRVVIDSGFARQPRFEPASGLTRLETVRISQASAEQRAGRAGRLGPGVCYRLWSEGSQGSLLPFTPPEIRNADLAP